MTTVLLVNSPAALRTLTHEAARLAFPDTSVETLGSVQDVLDRPPVWSGEIVVLPEPSARDLARITAATDTDQLRCWPVVVVGESWAEEWAEVAPPDADARLLSFVLKCAVAKHRLRRDCARARGDLWTMGRRLTHDMRTPVGCIVTASDALLEMIVEDESGASTLVKSISDSAGEMARLVERVGVVAKATADTVPRERVDMSLVFSLASDRLQAAASRAGAQIREPADWPEVRGVASWLETIWRDLLANAIEHAGPQPQIEVSWHPRDDDAEFTIRDHGAGVAREQRERLFQSFHRLHELNSARGLGLAIVRRLVELQGGSVSYAPAPGGGSSFSFCLPLAARREANGSDRKGSAAHGSPVRFAPTASRV